MSLSRPVHVPPEALALQPVPSDCDDAISDGNVLVVFWTLHCRSCGELLHSLASFAMDQGNGLRVLAADMAQHEALGDRFRVMTLPTMLFFQNGQLHSVKVGPQRAEELRNWLNPFLVLH